MRLASGGAGVVVLVATCCVVLGVTSVQLTDPVSTGCFGVSCVDALAVDSLADCTNCLDSLADFTHCLDSLIDISDSLVDFSDSLSDCTNCPDSLADFAGSVDSLADVSR